MLASAESHDKDTFIASSIAELMFPARLHQKPDESRASYVIRARELYRKTILVPLRKCLDVPEVSNLEGSCDTRVRNFRACCSCLTTLKAS